MKRFVIASALACSFVWATAAHAQTCLGNNTHAAAPRQAGAGVAFASNSNVFLGGYGGGNDKFFVRGAGAVVSFSGGGSSKGVVGNVGREFAVDAAKKFFVCPNVTVTAAWGPSDDFSSTSAQIYQFGGDVGFVATKTGTTTVVPTAGFSIVRTRETFNDKFFDDSESFSDTSTLLRFGVGLLFNEKMALTPSLQLSMNEGFTETAFSTIFTIKVGK